MNESPNSRENSHSQIVREIETVDLSQTLRIKSVLNGIRNIGLLPASGLLLVSVGDRRLIVVAVIAYAAHRVLTRGSRAAAAVLVLLALAMAVYFEGAYREALARLGDRPSASRGPLGSLTDSGLRSLVELYRTLAWSCVGLGVVYIGGFVLAALYQRRAWTPQSQLDWRRRVALRVGFLRARMTPKAVLYGGLSLLCMLIVAAPGLIPLLALLLQVPRTERTAPILDWAFGVYGWWWTVVAVTVAVRWSAQGDASGARTRDASHESGCVVPRNDVVGTA